MTAPVHWPVSLRLEHRLQRAREHSHRQCDGEANEDDKSLSSDWLPLLCDRLERRSDEAPRLSGLLLGGDSVIDFI